MNRKFVLYNILIFTGIFLLFITGRIINKTPLTVSFFFSVQISLLALFSFNLALARWDTHRTRKILNILFFSFIYTLLVTETDWMRKIPFYYHFLIWLVYPLTTFIFSYKQKPFSYYPVPPLFLSIKRPLKRLQENLFRLFPEPGLTGLYRIGNPKPGYPLYISGNYQLTMREIFHRLKNADCWVLICDSHGINVWCSALAGHFTTEKILEGFKKTRVLEILSPGMGILPLLSAGGISRHRLSEALNLPFYFGPLGIELKDSAPPAVLPVHDRIVDFPVSKRLEMGAGSAFFSVIFCVFLYNFLDPAKLIFLIPLIYTGSILQSLFTVKTRVFPKALMAGLLQFTLVSVAVKAGIQLSLFDRVINSLLMIYIVFEFQGWSPIDKYSFGSGRRFCVPRIDPKLCRLCGECVNVCPRDVMELHNGFPVIKHTKNCICCRSCRFQCPENAIYFQSNEMK